MITPSPIVVFSHLANGPTLTPDPIFTPGPKKRMGKQSNPYQFAYQERRKQFLEQQALLQS